MSALIDILLLLGMLGSLLLIPLGLPGLWVLVLLLTVAAALGEVGWTLVGVGLVGAVLAEIVELAIVRVMGQRYGGSGAAFWGAVAGGALGFLTGLPVPVIGPLLAGFLGTFMGAGAVTLYETRSVGASARVGWGVVLARTAAVGVKVGLGFVLLGASALAMVL